MAGRSIDCDLAWIMQAELWRIRIGRKAAHHTEARHRRGAWSFALVRRKKFLGLSTSESATVVTIKGEKDWDTTDGVTRSDRLKDIAERLRNTTARDSLAAELNAWEAPSVELQEKMFPFPVGTTQVTEQAGPAPS